MTRDELAAALFGERHALDGQGDGVFAGRATTAAGTVVGVAGIAGGEPVGVDAALALSRAVLAHVSTAAGPTPLLVLVDTQSQAMARRDELLGLNEYLAHLAKSLALASFGGHRTVGVIYGGVAAGAFIATALATDILVALPGASPSVMDLPSIARVTKLPLARLEAMSRTTPIFAPGLDALAATGAVTHAWDDDRGSWARRLDAVLSAPVDAADRRDRLGAERGGRTRAASVARAVADALRGGGIDAPAGGADATRDRR